MIEEQKFGQEFDASKKVAPIMIVDQTESKKKDEPKDNKADKKSDVDGAK